MTKKRMLMLWGGLFVLCAGLAFVPEPQGLLRAGLTAVALGFFAPPAALLYDAGKRKDLETLRLLRNLSALSLGLTLALLVGNFLSALGSEALGDLLYTMLAIVSSPMVCCGYWALSLFLWACLLMASLQALGKR